VPASDAPTPQSVVATTAAGPAPAALPAAANPLEAFDAAALHDDYRRHDFDAMSRRFLEVLEHLRSVTYYAIDKPTTHLLNTFVKHFLYFLSQEDYVLSNAYASRFIDFNGVIANTVAMSEFGSTDPFVRILLGQQRNFTKVLALYSPRNRVKIDRRLLFGTSPALATQWYFCFTEGYRNGCADPVTLDNLREHVAYEDDRLMGINSFTHHAYFGATYIDHEHDR